MASYTLISADSHFVEPPKMWAERLDHKFRDRAPRAVKLDGKPGEYLVCEDIAPTPLAAFFSAGVPPQQMAEFMKRGFDEAPKAVHDPAERLKDQDRDNVSAEVIYTSMGMPLFGLEDAELRGADPNRVPRDGVSQPIVERARGLPPELPLDLGVHLRGLW